MIQNKVLAEELIRKWAPVLDHSDLTPIKEYHKRVITAQALENTEDALREASMLTGGQQLLAEDGTTVDVNNTTNISNFDPILISLVRRAMPNLIAYDVAGVQALSGPTGLIFALRAFYANSTNATSGGETFYNEVNTAFSSVNSASGGNTLGNTQTGSIPGVSNNVGNSTYTTGTGMSTGFAEALGANSTFPEMAFTIEKITVTAQSRALKAEYTIELAQDLKAIHGLDAETELSNILAAEILAEINREVIRIINITAVPGAQENVTNPGTFDLDVDSNGRWSVEKFKGLMFQIEREQNQIAKQTRRGKGNLLICSSDVASALQMAGVLDFTPALNANMLQVDDTGNTFAGVLNGRTRVYIDPYSINAPPGGQYMTVGYKGSSPFDAGLFYCPYVPLQMVRAVDPNTFQPKIGFKTRYGIVANPFAQGLTKGLGQLLQDSNVYYRRVIVQNLM